MIEYSIRRNVSITLPDFGFSSPVYTFEDAESMIGSQLVGRKYLAGNVFGGDTVNVADADNNTEQVHIRVLSPLLVVGDIITRELGLEENRIWLYNQKIIEPKDENLYIVLSEQSYDIFSSVTRYTGGKAEQYVKVRTTNFIDVKSRGLEALQRVSEVVMALNSDYSVKQQDLNAMNVSITPTNLINIGSLDGSAVPYHFQIMTVLNFHETKSQDAACYEKIDSPVVSALE